MYATYSPIHFFWIILVILIICAIAGSSRRRYWRNHMIDRHMRMGGTKTAKDLLDERFATGAISEDEYKKSVETLKNHQ